MKGTYRHGLPAQASRPRANTINGYAITPLQRGKGLGRIFAAYAIVVLTFAALFLLPTFLNGTIPTIQQAADALQISLNAIHGRVFFAQLVLDSVQAWIATIESVVGIVIEGVFVAMLIQRFFGR